MGGTEILPVLKGVYNSGMAGSAETWRREIIFLTDGNVVNHSEVSLKSNMSSYYEC